MTTEHLAKMASEMGVKIPGVDFSNPKDLLSFVESLVAADSSDDEEPVRPTIVVSGGRGRGRPPGSGRGRGRPPGSGRGRGRPARPPTPEPEEEDEDEIKPEVIEVISDDAACRAEASVNSNTDSDSEAEVQAMLEQAQAMVESAVGEKSE